MYNAVVSSDLHTWFRGCPQKEMEDWSLQAQYDVLELAIEITWSNDHFKHSSFLHSLSTLDIPNNGSALLTTTSPLWSNCFPLCQIGCVGVSKSVAADDRAAMTCVT